MLPPTRLPNYGEEIEARRQSLFMALRAAVALPLREQVTAEDIIDAAKLLRIRIEEHDDQEEENME